MPAARPHAHLAGLILSLALSLPALAQERTPDQKKALLDLARVLGEAHALRQACDAEDQTWRSRMQRLIEVEAPDEGFEGQLAASFNAGFGEARAAHPKCDPAAEAKAAGRGRRLAEALAR